MKLTPKQIIHAINPLDTYHESWEGVSIILMNQDEVFLIKRSDKMPTHAGHIAGIGGLRKKHESEISEVAFREFEEETFLLRGDIELLGLLPKVFTARNQSIVPVIAWLNLSREEFFKKIKSNGEWTDVFSVGWSDLFEDENWSWGKRIAQTEIKILLFPLTPSRYKHYQGLNHETYTLWGATAFMIWSFIERYKQENAL